MTSRLSCLFVLALVVCFATSCERIPPSVSIPGYEEKKAAEDRYEAKTLGAVENPPTFFSGQEAR